MLTIHEMYTQLNGNVGHGQEMRKHVSGQVGHQGDIYVLPIKRRPACWNIETSAESRQVAVGQGEGSNHCAIGPALIYWPTSKQDAADNCPIDNLFSNNPTARLNCLGPIVDARGTWKLPHPKHAHHEFPAGLYLIVYQFDWKTQRRVVD